ncbi:TPA: DUF4222 domain-containing protein [Enterobacter ludwigii]
MTKKHNQASSEGTASPKIRPGDKWGDGRGESVTVESYRFNRVSFIREGYTSPCVWPDTRFVKEFTLMEKSQ